MAFFIEKLWIVDVGRETPSFVFVGTKHLLIRM